MKNKAESRDLLIKGGRVLTIDPAIGDFETGDVLIRDGLIVEVGVDLQADVPVIDARDHIVMPGFVDTHTHMWNSLWRTVPQPYMNVHRDLGPHYHPEDSYAGVKLTATEMVNAGVTTVHAWEHNCRTPGHVDAEFQALRDVGIRRHYSYGYYHQFTSDQVTDFADIVRARDEWADDLTTVGFASRAVVLDGSIFPTATEEVRQLEWREARRHGLRITHHTGTDQVPYALEAGLGGDDVLFVHGYHWTADAWKEQADMGTRLSFSPYTSMDDGEPMKFGAIRDSGITFSLSYDHLSGPGGADTFRLMHTSYWQARFAKDPVSARELVEYATIGGARALDLQDRTGSITPGKSADIILVDTRRLGLTPLVEPYHALVNSAHPADVATVLVAGRQLKRDGTLLHLDEKQVRESATSALHTLFRRGDLDEQGARRG